MLRVNWINCHHSSDVCNIYEVLAYFHNKTKMETVAMMEERVEYMDIRIVCMIKLTMEMWTR